MTLLGVAFLQLKIRVGKLWSQDKVTTELPRAVEVVDVFQNIVVKWRSCLGTQNFTVLILEGVTLVLHCLLNSIDGLRSSCGEERIVVFTTNQKDKPDPALLRPGRIDVLINMSYCSSQGFRLVSNYLDVHGQHPLLEQIDSI
ncbi:ATPase [Theobroma cacao]|nr:ATPase [Theobroma cacao]